MVLVRHGRSEWNAVRRIQGQTDIALDETGREQARAVAPVIAAMRPSLLWSSDLLRARQTTEYVAAATGLAASYDARLREIHLGERQGLTHAEYAAAHPDEYAAYQARGWAAVSEAEQQSAVAARFTGAVIDLAETIPAGGIGVVVTHGAAIRAGLAALLGEPPEAARVRPALTNCAWAVIDGSPASGWRLHDYNRTTPDFAVRPPVG